MIRTPSVRSNVFSAFELRLGVAQIARGIINDEPIATQQAMPYAEIEGRGGCKTEIERISF